MPPLNGWLSSFTLELGYNFALAFDGDSWIVIFFELDFDAIVIFEIFKFGCIVWTPELEGPID